MTENTECDPDVPSVRPEGASEESWEMLSDFERHTISQHVHPDDRVRAVEIGAFITAAEKFGLEEAESTSLLLTSLAKAVPEETVIEVIDVLGAKLPMLASAPAPWNACMNASWFFEKFEDDDTPIPFMLTDKSQQA